MKKLFAVVYSLAIIISSSSMLFSSNFIKSMNENQINYNKNNIKNLDYDLLQKWGENNNDNKNIIKEFKNAIYLDKNIIKVNTEYLKNDCFKEVVHIYKKLSININLLKQFGIKNDDIKEVRDFIINIEENMFEVSTLYSSGFSIEFKWYWFGWGKLKFDNELSEKIFSIASNAAEVSAFAELIGTWFPGTAIVLSAFALFCLLNATIFSYYNKGKGVWIGTYGWVIYNAGWGSL